MNARYPAYRRLYLNPRGNPLGTQTSRTHIEDIDSTYGNTNASASPDRKRQRRSISSAPLMYSRVFASDETLKNEALFTDLYLPLTKG